MRAAIAACLLVCGAARADTAHPDKDPAVAAIEHALPSGWTLLHTESELVIRHDRPVYVVGASSAPSITFELRYRLEPKWSDQQLADARAANERIAADALDQRAKAPGAGHVKADAVAASRAVKLPRCSLGDASVFDGDDTYAQLALKIDPPRVHHEAQQIADLVRARCGAEVPVAVTSRAEAHAALGKLVRVHGVVARAKLGDQVTAGDVSIRCIELRVPDAALGKDATLEGTLALVDDSAKVSPSGEISQGTAPGTQSYVLRGCALR